MRSLNLYNEGHSWTVFGRDPGKPDQIVDTNQCLIHDGHEAILLDPGGIELFAPMLASVLKEVPLEHIKYLFASHQDPDVISSLGLWDQVLHGAEIHGPWLWESFLPHFGMKETQYRAIPDEGASIRVGKVELQFIPAHYLHSSGNFNVYDPVAKILFSGDIGAALEGPDADLFVDDFQGHICKMRLFHQRWMPSNKAKNDWVERVRKLDIDMMVPQHGRIFKKDDFLRFLDWFEALQVGVL